MTAIFYQPVIEDFRGIQYSVRISEDGAGKCAYATELGESEHFAFVNGYPTAEAAYRAIRDAAEREINGRS